MGFSSRVLLRCKTYTFRRQTNIQATGALDMFCLFVNKYLLWTSVPVVAKWCNIIWQLKIYIHASLHHAGKRRTICIDIIFLMYWLAFTSPVSPEGPGDFLQWLLIAGSFTFHDIQTTTKNFSANEDDYITLCFSRPVEGKPTIRLLRTWQGRHWTSWQQHRFHPSC